MATEPELEESVELQEDLEKSLLRQFMAQMRNVWLAKIYFLFEDIISQREFAKRIGMDETRFSKILNKYRKKKNFKLLPSI